MNSNQLMTAPPQAGTLAMVRRNKFKFLATVLLGLILTTVFFSIATRTYRSSAKLFVKMGRETVVLDPTARTGQSSPVSDSREGEVFAVAELINSRLLAEKVVDHFGPEVILEKKRDSQSIGDHLSFLNESNLNLFRVYSQRDKAVSSFEKNLGVLAGKQTNVVSLWYEAKSPELARYVLEFLIEATLDDHIRIHRTRGTEEYFVGKVEESEKKLDQLELELRNFKTQTGLASLAKQRDALLELIAGLRFELLQSQSEEQALTAGLAARQVKLQQLPNMILIQEQTGQAQAVGQSLREDLFALEIQEKQLSSRYPADHPSVKQIRQQIAAVREISANERVDAAITQGVNPAYTQVESELYKNQSALAEVQAKVKVIRQDLENAEDQIAKFNDADLKVTKLEREIAMGREIVKTNLDMLEQARIDKELEERRISSLNVMQPPSYVETPANPKPMITFGVGGLLSLIAGFCVALFFDKTPRAPTVSPRTGSRSEHPVHSTERDSGNSGDVTEAEYVEQVRSSNEQAEPVPLGETAGGQRVPR